MKGTNVIMLSADSVLEALEDYLNKHAGPGVKFEAQSWGHSDWSAKDWISVELLQVEQEKQR